QDSEAGIMVYTTAVDQPGVGDLVSFTATKGKMYNQLKEVTAYTGFSVVSSGNPVVRGSGVPSAADEGKAWSVSPVILLSSLGDSSNVTIGGIQYRNESGSSITAGTYTMRGPVGNYNGTLQVMLYTGSATSVSTSSSAASSISTVSSAFSASSVTSGAVATYTIMTYNVEKFDKGGEISGGTYSTIATIVKTNQADVINLCEVENNDGDEASFATALTTTGWAMNYHSFSSMSDNYNSIGAFSRYSLSDVSEILDPPGPRTIYRYKVTFASGNAVWFYGCHLKSGTESSAQELRVEQAQALANYLRANHNLATDYIVLLGDMNTMNSGDWTVGNTVTMLELKDDGDASNDFTSFGRTAIYPNTTTFNFPSGLTLDHIVISPALMTKYVAGSAKRIGSGNASSNPTDHYAVRIKITL
ncbi:MAG TPA: endonuclease/exonuclease/phosphatase family protein, partial [Spirochaetota bacterium]|nr:endonuclease/exonuclease/phosphatase family protein [Spirochaetota bacterium]